MKERRAPQPIVARCKLVLVGDVQCGKTAMLQVLAKDCYPEVSCSPDGWPAFLLARMPAGGRFPPAQGSCLIPPHPSPSSAAFWLEDRPALASPETCSTSAAPKAPPHLFTHRSPHHIPSYLPSSWSLLLGEGTGSI